MCSWGACVVIGMDSGCILCLESCGLYVGVCRCAVEGHVLLLVWTVDVTCVWYLVACMWVCRCAVGGQVLLLVWTVDVSCVWNLVACMWVCRCAVEGHVLLLVWTVDLSCVWYLVRVTGWLGCFSGASTPHNCYENLSYYICTYL